MDIKGIGVALVTAAIVWLILTWRSDRRTNKKLGEIMAAIDDLKAAVSSLGTSISNELAAVKTAITNSQSSNDGAVSAADAEGLVAQLDALKTTVDNETAVLTAPVVGDAQGGTQADSLADPPKS